MAWLIFPLQVFRQTMRNSEPLIDRATIAFFPMLGRFPEAIREIKFMCDRLFGRQPRLIEYK
jgi:hypothetical protein